MGGVRTNMHLNACFIIKSDDIVYTHIIVAKDKHPKTTSWRINLALTNILSFKYIYCVLQIGLGE